MPSENVAKLELYPSVTHITVVVFLSTVKLLYPKSLVPKNYCDAVTFILVKRGFCLQLFKSAVLNMFVQLS